MKFFSKKHKNASKFEIEENDVTIDQEFKIEVKRRPDALTAEEVMGIKRQDPAKPSDANALDDLIKKLGNTEEAKENVAEPKSHFADDSETKAQQDNENSIEIAEEITPAIKSDAENLVAETKKESEPSLLDKCKPFISDENGQEVKIDSAPLYKLQSVADILKNDSKKAMERLSEKYDISFDDLGYDPSILEEPAKQKEDDISTTKTAEQPVIEQSIVEPPVAEQKADVFEESIPIKNMQSNVSFVISDIDMPETFRNAPENNAADSNTATITFTPIDSGKGAGSGITVSSQTRPIDLTGELTKLPEQNIDTDDEVRLEKNEFEDFVPELEYKSQKDSGKLVRHFSIEKRRAFIASFFSFVITIIFAGVKLPFMSEILLSHTKVSMIICTVLTGIVVLFNIDAFKSLRNLFKRDSTADICLCFATIATLVYAITGIVTENIVSDLLLLLNIILSIRALSLFYKTSYMLSNLKQITGNKKSGLHLVSDPALTFSMAKNAIEGEALIATEHKTEFVADFMKHSQYGVFLNGKLPVINIVSLVISIILGVVCGYYFDGVLYGLYAAAAIQCFTALPVVFLIENLPSYSAAKKLNKNGAMIAGKTGAEYIEMANAVVLNSSDLFPSGTVTLHQMKVLSENNLDDTIIRAASLTESLNSPLAPIFKQIAGTSDIEVLPDSDTVKYEDKMGISGWVDNRLLFIGNRTLMEAHGIEVPSIEFDRKILRQGFFPIYVATRDKACALLVVQYNVKSEISHELRKLARLGITMLINSCDPNLTEEMICDYFGLYTDSVKVMSAAGCHMYKNAVAPVKSLSAPAAFKSSPLALPYIINCASKIKRSNLLLTIIYVITLVLGSVIFAYSSLAGSGELVSDTYVMLYGLLSTIISYLIYLTAKP